METSICRIDLEEHHYDTEQAIAVFTSGAAQGYTTKEFYEVPIEEDYIRRFNQYARLAIEQRAIEGKVVVDFRRLFYVGNKPRTRL